MMDFSFFTTPMIKCGVGASDNLGQYLTSGMGKRALLVTDKKLLALGLIDNGLNSLGNFGYQVEIFDEVEADPSLATLEKAIEAARKFKASLIIGFGGGSSLDVAKLTALICGSGEPIDDAWGVGNAKGPRLGLVLVPTTAGTGSEVTPVSIITLENDEKRGVSSPVILPDIAILDAGLTRGLPAGITAATGIDAMVHAIEAYSSINPNNNPVSKMLAKEALALLGSNIGKACKQGDDLVVRQNMLLGSMLAGMAFANSPVAAVHALAYPIGGMFHIPHGLSNALILPEVMRFNLSACHDSYSDLAAIAFPHLGQYAKGSERGDAFIDALIQLSIDISLPQRLRDVGIGEADLPLMAKAAMEQTRLLVNNPRKVSEQDVLAIYQKAW